MKGTLKYYTKCEETPNSIEGWSILPVMDKFSSICYKINQKSLDLVSDYDKSQAYDVEFILLTDCRIDENGYHVHHSVIAEII